MGGWFGLYFERVAAIIFVLLVFKVENVIKAKKYVRHKIILGLAMGVFERENMECLRLLFISTSTHEGA